MPAETNPNTKEGPPGQLPGLPDDPLNTQEYRMSITDVTTSVGQQPTDPPDSTSRLTEGPASPQPTTGRVWSVPANGGTVVVSVEPGEGLGRVVMLCPAEDGGTVRVVLDPLPAADLSRVLLVAGCRADLGGAR